MKSLVLCGFVGLVTLAASGPARAAYTESDISWIGKLPGLTLFVEKTVPSGRKLVFNVSGDTANVVDRVRDGLAERGWTVEKSSGTGVAGITARTIVASKGGSQAKIVLSDALGIANLTVTLSGSGSAAATSSSAERKSSASAGGGPLEFMDSSVKGTYSCDGRDVTVNGNQCRLTLTGSCHGVTINGNTNTLRIEGTVESISALGNGNIVAWSAAANPKAPRVSDLGNGNQVRKEE